MSEAGRFANIRIDDLSIDFSRRVEVLPFVSKNLFLLREFVAYPDETLVGL